MAPQRRFLHILLLLALVSCRQTYFKRDERFSYQVIENLNGEPKSDSLILPYRKLIEKEMNEVIAYSEKQLTRDGSQSSLGNFVCDALFYSAGHEFKGNNADLVVVNRGGLRNNLPQGNINKGSIFEVMPFDNSMVLVTLKGSTLISGLPVIAKKRHAFFGMKMTLKNDQVIACTIRDKPIDSEALYSIITSDYLLGSGDGFNFLGQNIRVIKSDLKIRDGIINYCYYLTKNNLAIKAYKDERLTETE